MTPQKITATILLATLCPTLVLAHEGHVHSLATQACAGKEKMQTCQYTPDNKHLYQGSCQSISETLMCVRNKPIVTVEHHKSDNRPAKTAQQKAE